MAKMLPIPSGAIDLITDRPVVEPRWLTTHSARGDVDPLTWQTYAGWPEYELSQRATMRFDTVSRVVADPRSAERSLWEGTR